ncbi:HEAT repeat domain-containing protein [Oscillatoria acuminata]|uniref:HEAT repeat protein n=1 Tax=Oscillatoria acuminata PCC 6304 TaxID=56110 RepID=K9TBD2_9CYAN|nr:HEAT repeat domain-containing protein [Oscillatoria acuminata]AFY80207.1 HEAT repeat protein [Oscillatoria acuminata PCC 6304]
MSTELTDALNQILSWVEQYKPWFVDYLQPGLSKNEIDKLVKNLPVQVPPEVYELYQWRNGATKGDLCKETAWIFENWTFQPLQEALLRAQSYHSSLSPSKPEGVDLVKLFPIFYPPQGPEQGVIEISINKEFYSPVIFLDFEQWPDTIKKYASLTSMMLTMAECYETGAYYHDEKAYDQSYISSHPEQVRQIWRKYNSNLGKFAVKTLQRFQPINWEILEYFSDEFVEFKNSETVKILIHTIQHFSQQNDEFGKNIVVVIKAIELLGELGDPQTLPTLIKILNLESDFCRIKNERVTELLLTYNRATEIEVQEIKAWALKEVRKIAAWALGEIEDLGGTEPLIETLHDSESEVRSAAAKALTKLILKFPDLEKKIPF